MTPEEILYELFDPIEFGRCKKDDLQLAVTLNPSVDRILTAMEEYGKQQWNEAIKLAAEEVEIIEIPWGLGVDTSVNKQSILKLLK